MQHSSKGREKKLPPYASTSIMKSAQMAKRIKEKKGGEKKQEKKRKETDTQENIEIEFLQFLLPR